MSFYLRLFLRKTNAKTSKAPKNLILGPFWPFLSSFGQKRIFLYKKSSASLQYSSYLISCKISEKTNDFFREKCQINGWTDGQTDRQQWFYGGPIYILIYNYKNNKLVEITFSPKKPLLESHKINQDLHRIEVIPFCHIQIYRRFHLKKSQHFKQKHVEIINLTKATNDVCWKSKIKTAKPKLTPADFNSLLLRVYKLLKWVHLSIWTRFYRLITSDCFSSLMTNTRHIWDALRDLLPFVQF